jgi:hypothetical protein
LSRRGFTSSMRWRCGLRIDEGALSFVVPRGIIHINENGEG